MYEATCTQSCERKIKCWYKRDSYNNDGTYWGTRNEVCVKNIIGRGAFVPVQGDSGLIEKHKTVACNAKCDEGDSDIFMSYEEP